uniref:Uncharacterized protein n=1 Tax=Bracon brevicornis TaxID=1563983 RepID=A0A6V7HP12_9HYME
MIIASEAGYEMAGQPVPTPIPNPQSNYQDNPWLRPQEQPHTVPQQNYPEGSQNNANVPTSPNQYQPTTERTTTEPPAIILTTTTPRPTQPPPPSVTSTKSPFPSFDNIDWTGFMDSTTKKSSPSSSLSQAIDGDGIIEPRFGAR